MRFFFFSSCLLEILEQYQDSELLRIHHSSSVFFIFFPISPFYDASSHLCCFRSSFLSLLSHDLSGYLLLYSLRKYLHLRSFFLSLFLSPSLFLCLLSRCSLSIASTPLFLKVVSSTSTASASFVRRVRIFFSFFSSFTNNRLLEGMAKVPEEDQLAEVQEASRASR